MLNTFRGLYDNLATYQIGDAITFDDMAYICKRSIVTGCPPPDRDIWKRMGGAGTARATGLSLGSVGNVGISGCQEGVFISTSGPRGKPGMQGHPGFPPSAEAPQFHSLVSGLQAQTDIPVPQTVDRLHIYLVYTAIDSADWDETDAIIAIAKDPEDARDCARNNSRCGGAHHGGYTIVPEGKLIVKYLGVAAPGLAAGLLMSSVHGSYRR